MQRLKEALAAAEMGTPAPELDEAGEQQRRQQAEQEAQELDDQKQALEVEVCAVAAFTPMAGGH